MGAIDRIFVELEHSPTAIQKRLDAIRIGDEPKHRAKGFQRAMLNGKLRDLIARLEGGKLKLQELLVAPPPAAALQLTPVPRVAGRSSAWSSATVNAVLQQTSMAARHGSTSATSTPLLAWRDDDTAGGGAAAAEAPPRSPDQRRLQGLFAIDPKDFAPEFNFDFSTHRQEDEEAYTRGGQPYYRPCGWKRFALDVKDAFGLDDCTVKELKYLLSRRGGRPTTAGMEKADLVRMAREAGGDEYARVWLGEVDAPGEWINAFHGTSPAAAAAIARSGLRRGRSAASDDGDDGVERANGATFGPGVYCTPRVEEAEMYAEPIEVSADIDGVPTTKFYHVVFQCRVRGPACASHAQAVRSRGFYNVGLGEERADWNEDYWVVPKQEDVRPYAVLMQECEGYNVES
jgi:hypothetical protein